MADRLMRLPESNGAGPLVMLRDTGQVAADGSTIYSQGVMECGGDGRPTLFGVLNQSAGTATLVAGVASTKIRLVQLYCKPSVNTTLAFLSNAVALCGVLNVVQAVAAVLAGTDGSIIMPYSPVGWMETVAGDPLRLTVTGGPATGVFAYQLIPG